MTYFPEILPADARAPEGMRHRRNPLKYGFFGSLFQKLIEGESKTLGAMPKSTLKDIGIPEDSWAVNERRHSWSRYDTSTVALGASARMGAPV